MLTLKVRDQIITWPEDFAAVMMEYYQKNGVPYLLQKSDNRPNREDAP